MLRTITVLAVVVAVLISGCGRPPRPQYEDVYRGLSENLPRLDPSILDGRRVLIDPGHGGHFSGTLGQNGLAESRVNLGVSLYLWGLLREAGAEVFLTRSAERDFLTEADSSLAGELGVRVTMVDSLQPDILVSIHHNAQNDRDPTKNAVETYYRFGDQASRDLAFAVHRHLMRNLGIEYGEVRAGNYFILRNIDVPAILGEGSYLTHPAVESSLRLSDKQRLEAEAYFLGILEYFSRGTPQVEALAPMDTVLTEVPTIRFRTADIGGLGIDPSSTSLDINGISVDPHIDSMGEVVSYPLPWDSPNGPYQVSVVARNLLGNSSRTCRLNFRLDLPPVTATFDSQPGLLPRRGGTIRVRARLLDHRGLSVADGTPVVIEVSAGDAPRARQVENGFVEFPITIVDDAATLKVKLSAHEADFELIMNRGPQPGHPLQRIVIVDAHSGVGLRHALVLFGDSLVANGSASGVYFLPGNTNDRTTGSVVAAGYEPLENPFAFSSETPPDTLQMTPWYGGRLLGKRFIVDPEGGFGPEAGIGRLGLSGPHVNLQVARYLAEYLEAAGAIVELTRRTEETLSPRDVVAVTNRFRADRYVEIRHRSAPEDSGLAVRTFFFPGSRLGSDMAKTVQAATARSLGLKARAPRSHVTFPLQQTACPAIVVEYPSLASIEEELRAGEPWYQRRQAYGVFAGVLAHFGVVDTTETAFLIEVPASERGNWLLTVDKTWNLLTDPDGSAALVGLSPHRKHRVDLRRGDRRVRMVVDLKAREQPSRVVVISIPPSQ
ncbi:MAG: N-acetylmuramoyl-L-alanine amidase [Candidatus Krumholzibacteria bacterium]|nr:N-acetylmuramoyl-L-alanine amidase [Candidatus Krumholzibacteria bacterium]